MIDDQTPAWQPWISGAHFNDFDAQAAQLHGYDQQYQQLSSGHFEGSFRSFTLGTDLGIHFEMANRVLAQTASAPPGRYAVCILSEASPFCTLNAASFSENHIAICPEYKVLEGTTAAGVNLCCMDMSRQLLPDEADDLHTAQVLAEPVRARQLRELILCGLRAFMALDSLAEYPAAVTGFKSSLGDLLWQTAMRPEDQEGRGRGRYASARTLRVFRRAREYIHAGLADGVSIVELCKAIGVSRRSLESVFRSVVGMGPANYIRSLQLNHIRRDLILESSGDVSIGVIAARRGVWHWSRFSSHYRSLFGELPSQTRLRHSQRRPGRVY